MIDPRTLGEDGTYFYDLYKRASEQERREVLGKECDHPDQEDGRCVECGAWMPPFDDPA